MVTMQAVKKARRMIENQKLAEAAAKQAPRGSARRNNMLLLARYSNLIANELVSTSSMGGE